MALQTNELVIPATDSNYNDLLSRFERDAAYSADLSDGGWRNRLIYGDNLLAMQALLVGDAESGLPGLRGAVDLIYIDPPYDSKADYSTSIHLPGADVKQRPTTIEQFAYSDTWSRDFGGETGVIRGTAAYLAYLYPRLVLMRELLSESGSIFVHLDWHVGHYVKMLLDDIFGSDALRNEIIWYYWNKFQMRDMGSYARNHDTIFFYAKDPKRAKFFPQKQALDRPKKLKRVHWDAAKGRIQNLKDENGRVIYQEVFDEKIDDVWDLPYLGTTAHERLNFPTQKPRELVSRIVESVTEKGDLVIDFFAGSGTTPDVARRLERRWIASDLGKPACMLMRKRLIDGDSMPFLYQSIGDYQKEQLASAMGTKYRIGDLSQVVLGLYGALPFNSDENPNRNLGYMPGGRTLVMVDSPNKMCGKATLERAQREREAFRGGWDKVVVLAWNFVTDIGQVVRDLADSRLEVLVIPPDLLDKLSSKATYKKLVDSGKVRFSSLQYLTIAEPQFRGTSASELEIEVRLQNYVLLSPDALPLDDANKQKLRDIVANNPLDLIEYWSIDPDFDGEVFRSVWQDYRGNTDNDDDPMRVVRKAMLRVPHRPGSRVICVRAVDVFGFESEVRAAVSYTP